jgi:hypothetical protein
VSPDYYLDLVAGEFSGTSAEQLAALIESWQKDGHRDNLVVHFHGGLVGRHAALEQAKATLFPAYRQARAYPVFFVWNSDLITAVTANLEAITQEEAFRRLVRRVAQFAVGAMFETVGGRGDSLAPVSLRDLPEEPAELERHLHEWEKKAGVRNTEDLTPSQERQVQHELENDLVLKRVSLGIAEGLLPPHEIAAAEASRSAEPVHAAISTRMSTDVLRKIAEEAGTDDTRSLSVLVTLARYGVQVLAAVLRRYRAGRDHGLYDTVVQEVLRTLYLDNLGILAWRMMKKNTEDAFGTGPSFGGTTFLSQLAHRWHADQRITLVGHSTGAIYIGHFLEHADRVLPAEAKMDVVFLAPACTFAFLFEKLEVFRRRVRRLHVFGLKDERERSYWEVPLLSRGSLLYIVAGLLEDEADTPLLGMQRYHTGACPYDMRPLADVLAYLKTNPPVWAVDDTADGRRSAALTHGGMATEPLTLASVQYLLREGR